MSNPSSGPPKFRSLSVKFFRFTACLVLWIVAVILAYDMHQGGFHAGKGVLLCVVVVLVASAIARFTINLLIKPIRILQHGMEQVGQGNLKRIKFPSTGDEIEYLARSFNSMIKRLADSQKRIVEHHEELEKKVKDRTLELEEAMAKAMEASGAKSEFLANMSHELRTPMNGLLGMIELSLDTPSSAEQKEQLETAQRCALSLLALVNDVLDLSKIESGKMALEHINFNIASTLEDTLKGYGIKARQKGVLLEWTYSPSLPAEVSGDPLRLRQIVNNLVSNSIKFTSEGAIEVKISAHKSEMDASKWTVEIHVIDTGTGIPEDKLATIFEKFTQVDGSISRRYGGTGLGLAITKRLVELQYGRISVESELGLGSKFSIVLVYDAAVPVQAPVKTTTVSKIEEVAKPISQQHCGVILLVEDNLVNQRVVMTVLKKRGYEIDVASNGIEALAKMEQRSYAIILMDVQMPVMDGLEATRKLRQDDRWKDVPVIAMTAHAMSGDKERCIAAGMNAYISKPVHSAHLLATIEAYYTKPVTNEQRAHTKELMQPFLAQASEGLLELRKSVEAVDLNQLEQQVRNLREAAEIISATGVVESAKRVELAIQSKKPDEVTHGLLLLEGEITRLHQSTTVTTEYAVK